MVTSSSEQHKTFFLRKPKKNKKKIILFSFSKRPNRSRPKTDICAKKRTRSRPKSKSQARRALISNTLCTAEKKLLRKRRARKSYDLPQGMICPLNLQWAVMVVHKSITASNEPLSGPEWYCIKPLRPATQISFVFYLRSRPFWIYVPFMYHYGPLRKTAIFFQIWPII
jgi:hypothetical protein